MEPDDLYGVSLDRFVSERGAVAKALRAEGRRDEAAEVAGLRKPSAAGWAVNQLVRTQGGAVSELFATGDAVRSAQADLLAGRGDARALREAGASERDAVDALVHTARGLLSADGHELSASTLERVADTLHAAALDEDAREQVRAGRLERELRHAGLGLGEAPASPARAPEGRGTVSARDRTAAVRAPSPAQETGRGGPAAGAAAKKRAATDRAAEGRTAKERAAAAAAQEAARNAARRKARTAVAQAAKRAERAGHALRAAEERRDRAEGALAEATAAVDAARATAAAAAEEHRRATDELEAS